MKLTSSITLLVAAASLTCSAFAGIDDKPNDYVLRSLKEITLAGSTVSKGNVGALGDVRQEWGSTVTGKVESGDRGNWYAPELPDWRADRGEDIRVGWNETQKLDPGKYGFLAADSSTTVQLRSGQYNFTGVEIGWNGRVVADTTGGDVYLYISGALASADSTVFEKVGDGTLYLITEGPAKFGYKSVIDAAIYSRDSLDFASSAQLTGYAFAEGSITTGWDSRFDYWAAPIPAPASVALLAMGGGLLLGRRRRASA